MLTAGNRVRLYSERYQALSFSTPTAGGKWWHRGERSHQTHSRGFFSLHCSSPKCNSLNFKQEKNTQNHCSEQKKEEEEWIWRRKEVAKQGGKHFSLNKVSKRKFDRQFHVSLRPKEAHTSQRFWRSTLVQTEWSFPSLCFTIVVLLTRNNLLLSNQMQIYLRIANSLGFCLVNLHLVDTIYINAVFRCTLR